MQKKSLSAFLILVFVPVLSLHSQTQNTASTTSNQVKSADDKTADVAITATVTARELKFEQVPNPTVEFPGAPARETVWEADREKLSRPVEPGVTYRDIGIRLRISSRFADIERIVAEALGEIAPLADDSVTAPISPQNEIKSNENPGRKPVSQTTVRKRNPLAKHNKQRR